MPINHLWDIHKGLMLSEKHEFIQCDFSDIPECLKMPIHAWSWCESEDCETDGWKKECPMLCLKFLGNSISISNVSQGDEKKIKEYISQYYIFNPEWTL